MHTKTLFLVFVAFAFVFTGVLSTIPGRYLSAGDVVNLKGNQEFNIFCYKGRPKYIINIWQSVNMQFKHESDNFMYYEGGTVDEVTKEYMEHRSSWSLNLFSWKNKYFNLDPFNQSCVGIYSKEKYAVQLNVLRIDYCKVLSLIFGVILFVSASKLSKNQFFYYLCGISLGVCASFLILVYFISKLFPKKPFMYGVVIGGWTLGVYLLQMLWDNVRVIMTFYRTYLLWYIVITGFISFVVCYRFGPITNTRTQNIIKWFLQLLSLILIFNSSEFHEASMGQIVILLVVYNFPKSWVSKSKTYWKRKFPPRVRLLSNDEYYDQGVKHTAKALNELREFCSSPDCNQWKTALKLQDVKRFASFIEGNSHLSDAEVLDYESLNGDEITDDETESETDIETNAYTDEEEY
ncbi:nuclear envelope integral membrane protein-like [Onthophagus taurus]|uniref:nuclear envelope integral membrane protein-like n=1 Tax=Onthophagus taurus TaxID=166361 RepID=UPI000C209881|nr:nuclear envelope integral membrane protein 1-like [Onthophagus taurus]